MAQFLPHVERLEALAVHPAGSLLAIGGERDAPGVRSSKVHVLTYPKLDSKLSLAMDSAVYALAFSGDTLIIGSANGDVIGYDTASSSALPLFSEAAHEGAVRAIAATAAGDRVLTVGDDGVLYVFEILRDEKRVTLREHSRTKLAPRPLRAVTVDDARGLAVTGGDDSVVRSVEIAQLGKSNPREMPVGDAGVTALELSGDGRVIAGCADGSIRIAYLDGAPDEEDRSRDDAHALGVCAVQMGPQLTDKAERPIPRRLFSAGTDGTVKSWQLDSKRKPRTIELGAGTFRAMAFAPAHPGAEARAAGGTLLLVNRRRELLQVDISADNGLADSPQRIAGELARLRADLDSSKADPVRIASVRAAGDLPEDDARQLLDQTLAGDHQPTVRKVAAEVIGLSGRRRSRPALQTALADMDEGVRRAALSALTRIDADTPLSPVRAALRSPHADMRIEAISRLPKLRDVSPLVPSLLAGALTDQKSDVRMRALDALFAIEDKGSLAPVRTALDRGPADIRIAALTLMALAHQAREGEGQGLLEASLDDSEAQVRRVAFVLSLAIRSRLATTLRAADEALAKAFDELEKAGPLGDGSSGAVTVEDLQPVFAALSSRSSDTAVRGARTLALLGDSRAVGALLQLSREDDAGVRRQVVEALSVAARTMPGDTRVVGRLEWLLDDPDAEVRTATINVLRAQSEDGGPAGLLALAELELRAAYEDVRVNALQILVQYGGQGAHAGEAALSEHADALLGDALDDEAPRVREEAFRTLWAWHTSNPQPPLERGAASRHPDIRKRVVDELARIDDDWAEPLLLRLVSDTSADVGLQAFRKLTKKEENRSRADIFMAALNSPRAEVRTEACKMITREVNPDQVRDRLVELVEDEIPAVHTAAIEAVDRLIPDDMFAFQTAFNSIFYGLRVRAGELCGRRRDRRCVDPMKKLLTIPKTHVDRPTDDIRQRAARALADVGDTKSIYFYVSMLDDEDALVREMGSRGLATACGPGREQPLVDALAHADLAVRSWAAEGLARLGDTRALPVLAGTLKHEHPPIRRGSIISFVALGPDGVRGIQQGLEDPDRNVQDLVLSVIAARDIALARAAMPPDLLLSATSSSHPEIRFAATRFLEARAEGQPTDAVVQEMVAPLKPERASDMKDWPEEAARPAILNALINAIASDDPVRRYAAAQVLNLRQQPKGYWREAQRVLQASKGEAQWLPNTNWEDEARQPRKKDWIRRLFGSGAPTTSRPALVEASGTPGEGSMSAGEIRKLAFGTYAGLVRQAPPAGEADETHRVRRDAVARLAVLAQDEAVGREAVLPVFRRALSDPHHLVRRATQSALAQIYPDGSLEPLRLALESSADDVGRAAVNQLVSLALGGNDEARKLALESINAPNRDVRAHALNQILRLYEGDSLDPWLLALGSKYGDLRSLVVDRLMESPDARVAEALVRALESDHEDLRMKAAVALANRGDIRTVDVLGGLLRSENQSVSARSVEALISLAHARATDDDAPARQAAAARAVAARMEDDPDQTADKYGLVNALSRIGHPDGADTLLSLLGQDDVNLRYLAFDALAQIARDTSQGQRVSPDGSRRWRYDDDLAMQYTTAAAGSDDVGLRQRAVTVLRDVDDQRAEALLARLIDDREETIRVAACEAVAFRAEHVAGATIDPLVAALRGGRRELVLPAAAGMAARERPEAFQALMLVFKAGESQERQRAVLALGELGDRRALEELEPLVDPRAEIPDEDRFLAPVAAEALGAMLPKLEEPDEQLRVRETVESLARTGGYNVQLGALAGLRHAGDERSRALLERIAGDRVENQGVRQRAIEELGALSNPSSEPALAEVLKDPNYSLRHVALRALERIFPGAKTRTALLALQSPYNDVSEPAAIYLSRYGDAGTLVRRFPEIKDANVRVRLRQGLMRRGACPVPELEALLGGDDIAARGEAAWIAGAAQNEALSGPIATALGRTRTQWLQTWAQTASATAAARRQVLAPIEDAWHATLWAAGELKAPVAGDCKAAIDNTDVPAAIRIAAMRVLARQGTAADAEILTPALSDPDAGVRAAAAAALIELAPATASQTLTDLSVADAGAVTPVAKQAYAQAGATLLRNDAVRGALLPVALGAEDVSALVEVAKGTGSDQSRLSAVLSLGRMGNPTAEAALREILASDSEAEDVRVAASRALKRSRRIAAKRARREQGGSQEAP